MQEESSTEKEMNDDLQDLRNAFLQIRTLLQVSNRILNMIGTLIKQLQEERTHRVELEKRVALLESKVDGESWKWGS